MTYTRHDRMLAVRKLSLLQRRVLCAKLCRIKSELLAVLPRLTRDLFALFLQQ